MTPSTGSKPVGSYPSTGIDILIVGTGVAGLTATIECIRKGHSVRVLERDEGVNTVGMSQSDRKRNQFTEEVAHRRLSQETCSSWA